MKNKLRLDYFLSLGLMLHKKDEYTLLNRLYVISDSGNAETMSEDDKDNAKRFITSFAPRKNTGEQPCGDDLPVVVELRNGNCRLNVASGFVWSIGDDEHDIITLKPDLDALIKMQDEHDKEQAINTKPKRMKTEYVKCGDVIGALKNHEKLYFTIIGQDKYFECARPDQLVYPEGVFSKVECEIKTEKRWIAYNSVAHLIMSKQCMSKEDCYNSLFGNKFRDNYQYLEVEIVVNATKAGE